MTRIKSFFPSRFHRTVVHLLFLPAFLDIIIFKNNGSFVAEAQCVTGGFELKMLHNCTFDSLLNAFEPLFNDPINRDPNCPSRTTAEKDLIHILTKRANGSNRNEAESLLKAQCAHDGTYDDGTSKTVNAIPFHSIPGYGESFIAKYFNGGTHWNTGRETMHGVDGKSERRNVLEEDAYQVERFYEGQGRIRYVKFPDHLPNFDQCEMNAAYCCWVSDRQANDGNGNCEEPYDENCIDANPADNTDLCFVDLTDGAKSRNGDDASGVYLFPHDDHNNDEAPVAEGASHCHGFGWAEDESDPSSVFKGNNLFYVSMYDHLYQRGYVRNVPGAPMCACAEQMPVASRADCTQIDVEQSFEFLYDGSKFSVKPTSTEIDFNSCEGIDRYGEEDNNDLWSYMNRLYTEDKISVNKLSALGERLVGDEPNMCDIAIKKRMGQKGYSMGNNAASFEQDGWTQFAGMNSAEKDTEPKLSFNEILNNNEFQILLRTCPDCYTTHKFIYYKRLTPILEVDDELDLRYDLMSGWEPSQGNIWNVDFQLYSSYDDAVAGRNAWVCPSEEMKNDHGFQYDGYQYDHHFPGLCGPIGSRLPAWGQEGVFEWGLHATRGDTAWYVKGKSSLNPISGSVVIGQPPDWFQAEVKSRMEEMRNNRSGNPKLFMSTNAWNLHDEKDNFQFYSPGMQRGDFEVVVRLERFAYLSAWSRAGIVVREKLTDPGSKYFSILSSGKNGVFSQWRYEDDEWYDDTHNHWDEELPFDNSGIGLWMRLRREGDKFTSFTSSDGGYNWKLDTRREIPMSESLYIGLGLSADGHNKDFAQAVFTDYRIND